MDQVQRPTGPQLRLPTRPDGRPAEAELVLLKDSLAEKDQEVQREIEQKIVQHRAWNDGYLDLTRLPMSPVSDQGLSAHFRTARTEYLPTPPASVSSEASGDGEHADAASPTHERRGSVAVRYVSPPYDGPSHDQPSFRRRIGRGVGVMIDRRGMHRPSKEGVDTRVLDRFKSDHSDDEDQEVHMIDPFDTVRMRYRASILASHATHRASAGQAVRPPPIEAAVASGQAAGRPGSLHDSSNLQRPVG